MFILLFSIIERSSTEVHINVASISESDINLYVTPEELGEATTVIKINPESPNSSNKTQIAGKGIHNKSHTHTRTHTRLFFSSSIKLYITLTVNWKYSLFIF